MAYRRAFPGVQRAVRAAVASGGGSGAITPLLTASRTSGPAPLAVHFSGIGTTAVGVTDPFRELGYYFDFHDSGSGTWTHSGQSKNIETGGPLAAHVFETAGTYTVLMSARRSDGEWAQTSATITVQNPDTVFSGANTVCLSRTTDHTGAPAGATLLSDVTSWPAFVSNSRYLLRAGQDFTSLGGPTISRLQDVHLGRYGTGANPLIGGPNINTYNPVGAGVVTNRAARVTLNQLEFRSGFSIENGATFINFNRCGISAEGQGIDNVLEFYHNGGSGTAAERADWRFCSDIYLTDCYHALPETNASIYAGGLRYVVMGLNLEQSDQHSLRTYGFTEGLIAHCRLKRNSAGGSAHIKAHSRGDQDPYKLTLNGGFAGFRYGICRQNVIGDPAFGVGPVFWSINLQPENGEVSQGIEDGISENNQFLVDYQQETILGGRRMTDRGNTGINYSPAGGTGGAHTGGLPDSSWNGPYYINEPAIATQAPTR